LYSLGHRRAKTLLLPLVRATRPSGRFRAGHRGHDGRRDRASRFRETPDRGDFGGAEQPLRLVAVGNTSATPVSDWAAEVLKINSMVSASTRNKPQLRRIPGAILARMSPWSATERIIPAQGPEKIFHEFSDPTPCFAQHLCHPVTTISVAVPGLP